MLREVVLDSDDDEAPRRGGPLDEGPRPALSDVPMEVVSSSSSSSHPAAPAAGAAADAAAGTAMECVNDPPSAPEEDAAGPWPAGLRPLYAVGELVDIRHRPRTGKDKEGGRARVERVYYDTSQVPCPRAA
jgi:hypothetical protein